MTKSRIRWIAAAFCLCIGASWLRGGAAEAERPAEKPPKPIIIPLPDSNEMVIEPFPVELARLQYTAESLEEHARTKLWLQIRQGGGIDPARILFRESYSNDTGVDPIPLTRLAKVTVRPMTFVPLEELTPIVEQLTSKFASIREAARAKLRRLGGRAKNMIPLLLPLIDKAQTYQELLELSGALMTTGVQAAPAIPVLVSKIKEADDRHRDIYRRILESIGKPAVPVLEKLMLDEDDRWKRRAAALALAKSCPEGEEKVRQALVAHPNAEVRHAAASALDHRDLIHKDNIPPLIKALSDPDSQVRCQAACSLQPHGPSARSAVPALLGLMDDESGWAARAAIRALGAIHADAKRVVPRLMALLTAPPGTRDYDLRVCAAGALGEYGPPAVAAVPLIIPLLKSHPSVRLVALKALAKIGGRPAAAAAEQVGRLLADASRDEMVAAFDALAAMGPDAAPAVDDVVRVLEARNIDSELPCLAAVALGSIGPVAKPALPKMIDVLLSVGSVRLASPSVLRAMAAIDLDAAIAVIEAEIERQKQVRDIFCNENYEPALDHLRKIKALAGQLVATPANPPGPAQANYEDAWGRIESHAPRLRLGDPIARVIALIGYPLSIPDGGHIEYRYHPRPFEYSVPRWCDGVTITLEEGKVKAIQFHPLAAED